MSSRRAEIRLLTPLMIKWAMQVMDGQQVIWRGGYPSVMTRVYHDRKTGVASIVEVMTHDT